MSEILISDILETLERHQQTRRSAAILEGWRRRGLSTTEAARENRARRAAVRQGLRLQKSRRDLGDGRWLIADLHTNYLLTPERGLGLDEVEAYLAEAPVSGGVVR